MGRKRARGVDRRPLGALEREHDPLRIGPGCDDEVVLEALPAAIVDEVDTGIEVGVPYAAVRRCAGGGVRPISVGVRQSAPPRVVPDETRRMIGTERLQPDDGRLVSTIA